MEKLSSSDEPAPETLRRFAEVAHEELGWRDVLESVSLADLDRIISAAFFASLELDEGRQVTFALAVVSRRAFQHAADTYRWSPVWFENPIACSPKVLAKLAVAADIRFSYIALARVSGRFAVVGLLRSNSGPEPLQVPERGAAAQAPFPFVAIEAFEPGCLRVSVNGGYGAVAFRRGTIVGTPHDPAQVESLQSMMDQWAQAANLSPPVYSAVLRGVVASLALRRHGGTLLLNPPEALPDISLTYKVHPPSYALQDAVLHLSGDGRSVRFDRGVARDVSVLPALAGTEVMAARFLDDVIAFGADLASVDGAVVLDSALLVVGFGAKLTCESPSPVPVRYGNAAGPREASHADCNGPSRSDGLPATTTLSHLGTRHNSAARYCYNHLGTIACVVSQDGAVSWMSRSRGQSVLDLWRGA